MIRFFVWLFGIQSAVAGIVVSKNGEILLTKRSKILKEGGKWCLPGGGMEKWEKAVDSMKRELKEEVGINSKPKLLFVYEEMVRRLKVHANVFVFEIKYNGEKIKTNWEVGEYGWFSKGEIVKMDLAFSHKEMLKKYWSGR